MCTFHTVVHLFCVSVKKYFPGCLTLIKNNIWNSACPATYACSTQRRATKGPPAIGHRDSQSLVGRWWPDVLC